MSIAVRFRAALDDVRELDLADPELLPSRLARACARTLGVDGAGLSVSTDGEARLPLGASSPTAALAERLQFTAGDGPCGSAQRHQEPVFAACSISHGISRKNADMVQIEIGSVSDRYGMINPGQVS